MIYFRVLVYKIYAFARYRLVSDLSYVKKVFKLNHGYILDLNHPKTLNEKIQWLKLNYFNPQERIFADKLLVRDYIEKEFGKEILVPLVFSTKDVSLINAFNIPDYPVIIKANHDSGSFVIVRNKKDICWKEVRDFFLFQLSKNYFWTSREMQYKFIQPFVLVEKLLLDKNGKIPNDFKFHCINGIVEFVYVSIDREGDNFRLMFSRNWERLNFTWLKKEKQQSDLSSYSISKPFNFLRMIEISEKISKQFKYVRVDFYEVDDKLYFGEITQHHGSGNYPIRPMYFDYYYGSKIKI
jgi:hypothetical protein